VAQSAEILIMLQLDVRYGREVYRGVVDYARAHTDWQLRRLDVDRYPQLDALGGKVDGAIAMVGGTFLASRLEVLGVPVVNASGRWQDCPFPTVCTDDAQIGRMAAEHLAGLGFSRFYYYGQAEHEGSLLRGIGFFEALATAGERHKAHLMAHPVCHTQLPEAMVDRVEPVSLAELPLPAAAFCFNDPCAERLLVQARQMEIVVPGQLAILGADNDDLICESTLPGLASIDVNARQIGQRAAQRLDAILAGQSDGPERICVPPTHVVDRPSTDTIAVEDPLVRQAVGLLRRRIGQIHQVEDLLAGLATNRRTLERRFRAALGATPHQEIARTRVQVVKRLLATTELTIEQIAARAGFSHATHCSAAFRRLTGLCPTEYRAETRGT
jgi:LacI family transcriptional regulator